MRTGFYGTILPAPTPSAATFTVDIHVVRNNASTVNVIILHLVFFMIYELSPLHRVSTLFRVQEGSGAEPLYQALCHIVAC